MKKYGGSSTQFIRHELWISFLELFLQEKDYFFSQVIHSILKFLGVMTDAFYFANKVPPLDCHFANVFSLQVFLAVIFVNKTSPVSITDCVRSIMV